jgi:ubiquinone/menaquinone biosynthesis C-methylase UbiE
MPDRSRARELAAGYIEKGDPTGWFEALYREGEAGRAEIPWDDRKANRYLVEFWRSNAYLAAGKSAIVVGCGLGDDAEQISSWGFRTTAFDISGTAVAMARRRFPHSEVEYAAIDLFKAPEGWRGAFDFVFESNTLQALPAGLRPAAIGAVAGLLGPGGLLLVIARAREESEPEGELPWPLTRREFDRFRQAGLVEKRFEQIHDAETPHTRRFRATYTRH